MSINLIKTMHVAHNKNMFTVKKQHTCHRHSLQWTAVHKLHNDIHLVLALNSWCKAVVPIFAAQTLSLHHVQ